MINVCLGIEDDWVVRTLQATSVTSEDHVTVSTELTVPGSSPDLWHSTVHAMREKCETDLQHTPEEKEYPLPGDRKVIEDPCSKHFQIPAFHLVNQLSHKRFSSLPLKQHTVHVTSQEECTQKVHHHLHEVCV